MDKKIKADWVKALRSGKYTQGKSYLRRPDDGSFCCLGVLCAIIDPNTITSEGCGIKVGEQGFLPEKIRLEISGAAAPLAFESRLASLNDKGQPFSYIANIIERDSSI